MRTYRIRPTRLVAGDDLLEGPTVHIKDGIVVALDPNGEEPELATGEQVVELDGTLLPGLIDVQVNGAGGRSVDEATDLALDRVALAAETGGAAAFLPTLITAPFEQLLEQVRAVAEWIQGRPIDAEGAVPLGIHVEGPFLEVGGTHDQGQFLDPSPDRVEALLDAARGHLAMLTLAPGRAHAAEATKTLSKAGVCVAFGHAESVDGFAACVAEGARLVTHLFNAMTPLHHRAPGVTGHALDEDRLSCALILDGVHVDAIAARIAYRCLGPKRTLLVTDSVAAAGMPNGRYQLAGQPVDLCDGAVRDQQGRLAGSALTMRGAVVGFRSMLHEDDPIALALAGSSNAARVLRRDDGWGSIAVGAPARFALLGESGSVEALRF